eukprot:TRINITY_DN23572_c0_g2_i1.p1 TRINITY_DN23572_c0_g2~~TRINITY_DN23572_c0_g2_i1.p1  ORF type:complete len:270 (+),score=39.09 TRINITY_DN23572_c0_g2_i1:2-811(+)
MEKGVHGTNFMFGSPFNRLNFGFVATAIAQSYDEEIIEEIIHKAIDLLSDHGSLDIFSWCRFVICQVTFKMLMGCDIEDDLVNQLLHFEDTFASEYYKEAVLPGFIFDKFIKPPVIKEREELLKKLSTLVDEVLKEDIYSTPFISSIKAQGFNNQDEPISRRDIAEHLLFAAVTAITNSANGASEAIIQSSVHSKHIEKLKQSFNTLEMDEVTQAWFNECARLACNIFVSPRKVMRRNLFIGSYHIPRGSITCIAAEYLSTSRYEYENP